MNRSRPSARERSLVLHCFALALALAACAARPPIETTVTYRYLPAAADLGSYRIEFAGMPEFLKPMLRDEISRVLADRGLAYTEGEADALLRMTFDNEPLPSVVARSGTDGENGTEVEQVVAARFNAKVTLDMSDSVSGERIWMASVGRVHYFTEGAYMHEEPARRAIRDALRGIFADFPNQLDREGTPD